MRLFKGLTRLALHKLAAFVLAMAIGPVASFTSAYAQDEYFDLLDQAARNGAIADGFGYSYWQSGPSRTNVYQVRSSKEAANGVNYINMMFMEASRRSPIFALSFERCGNAADTTTMFEHLRDRPLLVSHIDDTTVEMSTGTVKLWDAFDIREISKSVTRWDDLVVRYDRTDQSGDGAPWSHSRFYIFVFSGWCLTGPGPDSSNSRLEMMFAIRDNALRALGMQTRPEVPDIPGADDADRNTDTIFDDGVTEIDPDGTDTVIPGSDAGIPGDEFLQPPGMDVTDIDQQGTNLADNYPANDASTSPVSPVAIAAGTVAAGGIAGLGAWLMLGQAGVGRREMLDAVGDLARGRLPSDGFDDWKARYEAMGWTYREENGVAVFDPPPGYNDQVAAPPPVIERHRDGETNADTGEVWSDEDGGWIGRNLYEQEKRRAGDIAAIEARNRQAVADWDAKTQALDSAIASSARDRAARAAAEEAARIRIGDKLSRLLEADGISTEAVERMRRERDTVGLEDLYERTLRERMARTSAEAAAFNREAAIYRAGELASKALLAGSKATMMAVTGPAGYIPAIIGSGVLRSAEEGAGAYVRSDGDRRELGTALVSGFFAGAKDGVVGRFTGLPRTGNVTKVVLPAAADAGETYIRTGDIKATMTTGLMSAAGGAAGSRMDRFGSAVAREAGQAATGATMSAVGAAVNGGSIPDAMMDGMADAIGGRLGQHVGAGQTPMTRKEIAMDLEYKAKLADARGRIDAFDKAVASGDPARIKPALQDVLEHREAKVLLKGKDVDPGLKTSFSELTQEHRTRPVMDGTADALNRQTVSGPDGVEQPRFVIRDANGVERPVTGADFASGSGKPGEPGVDLDMYPKGTIIDKATGRPAKGADVDQAVSESCARLGIDRRSQEVNVTGMKGTEDITMRPGETPEQFYARAGRERAVSAAEGTGAAEVGTHKLHAADDLHGDGAGSSALAEKTRGVMKDKGRLIDPLIAGDGGAQIPEVFRRMEPVKRTSAIDVLQQLADGSIPPGTANAKFRQLTNMDIDQALPKIAGWSEGLGKWGSGSPGGSPLGPSFTGAGGASNLQQVAAAFIRNVDATKSTE